MSQRDIAACLASRPNSAFMPSPERLHDALEAAYNAGVEQGRKSGHARAALR